MNTVIFDIETVGMDFSSLDDAQKFYLFKGAENDEDKEKAIDQMALWAPTNQIVAIGMLSVESEKGAMYFSASAEALADKQSYKIEDWEDNGIKYWAGDEKEILEKFWKAISHANKFVTFNGRNKFIGMANCFPKFLQNFFFIARPIFNTIIFPIFDFIRLFVRQSFSRSGKIHRPLFALYTKHTNSHNLISG